MIGNVQNNWFTRYFGTTTLFVLHNYDYVTVNFVSFVLVVYVMWTWTILRETAILLVLVFVICSIHLNLS